MILVEVNGQSLFVKKPVIAEESVKYLKASFSFSKDWDGYSKVAFFKTEDGEPLKVILDESNDLYAGDGAYFVPQEVMVFPHFYVSLSGSKGDSKITTESIKIDVKESGASDGQEPKEPTLDAFSQITQMCTDAMNEARQMSEKAEAVELAKNESAESSESAKQYASEAKASSLSASESEEACLEVKTFVEEKTQENAVYNEACSENALQTSTDVKTCESATLACTEAKNQTEAAKLALEEGVEWVFEGGNAETVDIKALLPTIDKGNVLIYSETGETNKRVRFNKTFKKTPVVTISKSIPSIKIQKVDITVKEISTTGFTVSLYSGGESNIPITVNWIAAGE